MTHLKKKNQVGIKKMISKKYLKPQQTALKKHSRKTKYLTLIVLELIKRNELMKYEMRVTIDQQYVDPEEDNLFCNLIVSIITFGFLTGMKHLHGRLSNPDIVRSQFELNQILYSALLLQIIYMSIYLKKKKNIN